jgi:nitrogen fixation protein NifX
MQRSQKITIEGDTNMAEGIKVAFATKDMENVNAHFGGAREFVVYNVAKEGFSLSGVVQTDTDAMEGDDKTDFKVKALSGVNIMYCESIGGTAAAKVIRNGISPMKVQESRPIADVLGELVDMLNGNPPPWIRKILHIASDDARLVRWAE